MRDSGMLTYEQRFQLPAPTSVSSAILPENAIIGYLKRRFLWRVGFLALWF
jgi:hypothetical protein